MAVPTKEVQIIKVETSDGFFVALDQTASRNDPILQRYGVPVETFDKGELSRKLHQMRSRIFTDPKFNGSRVIATTLSEDSMDRKVSGMPTAKYLWQVKHVVPFLRVDRQYAKETNGVRLINDTSKLDKLLDKACSAGMFGTKARNSIRLANAAGIKAVVDQQFEIASKVMAKGLVPILMPEVDISSPDKGACEELLLDALMAGLQKLRSDEKVIFWLTLPTKSNQYFPLIHHPNSIRLVALSGGYNRGESCQMLKQNCGMVAGFGRAFTEEMRYSMSDKDFSKVLDEACEQVFRVSKRMPVREEQAVKVSGQEGFFVALDQTGNNTRRILESYGWASDELGDQTSLQAKLHAFRARVFTHPRFNGSRVIGVLLSTDTMDMEIAQLPTPQYLWEQKKVVPFLRVDRGVMDEADGVQLMRDIPRLPATLEKATQLGFFGVKHRNIVLQPNSYGIKQAVEQQFEVARLGLKAGLVPIIQIEVDINSPDKADCERILRQSLMSGLRTIDKKDKVILLLSIPTKADAFRPLMEHDQVLRVLASSGGYRREQACDKLRENAGLVASFGRAFLDAMNRRQTDNEFARAMDESCDAIFQASRQRADAFLPAAGGAAPGDEPRGQARKSTRAQSCGDELSEHEARSKSNARKMTDPQAPEPHARTGSKASRGPPKKSVAAPAPKKREAEGADADADSSSDPVTPDQVSSPCERDDSP
ncbi:unnamed protein product [Prorocentrum cordatum]|uniref:fructose-bisphosphate aldolase n=1 Tax=Prorocentrum cordatum TaxID=2364126 RepID=A0ABN9WRU4_9DINO|nr:unnamed protein product [Polarella glacialis]